MKCRCKSCGKRFEAEPREWPAEHRLLIGDSTNAEDLAAAMNGNKAAAVITDPPYPQEFDHVWDVLGSPCFGLCRDDAFLVSLCCHYQLPRVLDAIRGGGWDWYWLGIATNNNQPIMHGFSVKVCFKPCVVFIKGKKEPNRLWVDNFSLRAQTQDWEASKAAHQWGQADSLFFEPLDSFTDKGDVVFEPFCGGGSTMTACEKTGRRCYAMELDPAAAAATLERLALMGLEPRRLSHA